MEKQKKHYFSEESELAQKKEKRKTFTELKTLFSSILTILHHPITAVSSFNDLADTVIRARLDLPSTDIRSHYCESIKKISNSS